MRARRAADRALRLVAAGGLSYTFGILFYTNKYRQSKGKSTLQLNKNISKVAAQHSSHMAEGKIAFGHNGFKDRTSSIRKNLGSFSGAAENVAYGKLSAQEVVNLWIKSKTHRKNLLGDFRLMGVGVVSNSKGVLYFTQIFINN